MNAERFSEALLYKAKQGEYWERGEALAQIRLGFGDVAGFGDFCTHEIGLSYERARLLIQASVIRAHLATIRPLYLPAREAYCKPLAGLDPDRQIKVWQTVCLAFPEDMLTADRIQAVVDQDSISPDRPLRVLTRADVPDCRWPTNNDFDIPLLSVEYQAGQPDIPFLPWGSESRKKAVGLSYHFYTDDSRFAALWADPTPVVNSRCLNAVEINFSIYDQTPRVVGLHRIYMKRWIARWWQSLGIKILVDLNVAENFAEDNLLGVPAGWRSYATRGYTDRLDATHREYDRACHWAGTSDIVFVVYGGGKLVHETCKQRGWAWFPEYMDQVRGNG